MGFARQKPPHAPTISRAVARCSLEQFRDGFARGLTSQPQTAAAVTVAVDGTTSQQGHDAQGAPIPRLNGCAHDLNLCLAQFPVTDGTPTEPQARKHGLKELLDPYPCLRLFTGDALFCQRPWAQGLWEADRDFLFAVTDHQPEVLAALTTSVHDALEQAPDATIVENKGSRSTPDGFGFGKVRRSTPCGRRPSSRASS